MLNIEEVKKLIQNELQPVKVKITEFESKISEMDKSYSFLSEKYDQLLKQIKNSNENSNKLESSLGKLRKDLSDTETGLRRDLWYTTRNRAIVRGDYLLRGTRNGPRARQAGHFYSPPLTDQSLIQDTLGSRK